MSRRKRKTPRRHTVHTAHQRYNVNQYPRGTDPPYMQRMRKLHLKTVDDTIWRRVHHDEGGAYIYFSDDMGNQEKLYVRELNKITRGNVFQVPQGHPSSHISHRDYSKYPTNEQLRAMKRSEVEKIGETLIQRHQELHLKNQSIEEALRNTPNLPRDQYSEIRMQMEKNRREMAEIRSVTHQIGALEREREWKEARYPTIEPTTFMLRASIGHYGGTFVDVPAEEYDSFRANFDKRAFPRGENIRNVTYSGHAYKTVFFDNGTKSSKQLEKLRSKGIIKLEYR
jgi:hypothetical protein